MGTKRYFFNPNNGKLSTGYHIDPDTKAVVVSGTEKPVIAGEPILPEGAVFDGALSRWNQAVDDIRTGKAEQVELYGTLALVNFIPGLARECSGNRYQGKAAVNIESCVRPGLRVLPTGEDKHLEVVDGSFTIVTLRKYEPKSLAREL